MENDALWVGASFAGKTSVIFLGTRRGTLDSLERKPVFQRSYRAERF
jgi:hypothetical protein